MAQPGLPDLPSDSTYAVHATPLHRFDRIVEYTGAAMDPDACCAAV